GCVAGIASLAVNVPRYVIEADLGATALGHFTALSHLFVAATQPLLALAMAVNPRLGRHFVTDLGAYRRLTWQTMLIAGGLGLLGIAACALFGRSMLTLVYAPEYAAHDVVLIWLAVATGVGFLAQALSYAVTAARRLPGAIRRHPTLQNLALDLRGVGETITLRRDRDFLAFAMSVIRRDTDRAVTALSACRGVLRKLGVHSVLAREAHGWKAVLVDEGTIHSAHYVLVHVNHPPRREDVEAFCRLVPMPD